MTLGEIKAEALLLMHMDKDVDGTTVCNFENDENFGTYIAGMPGALNRALADLESRLILPLRRVVLHEAQQLIGREAVFSLEHLTDLFAPERLVVQGEHYMDEDCPYSIDMGQLRVFRYDKHATYTLLYHPVLQRVTHTTPDSTVLDLPEQLAAALPYYLKADLYRIDEPGEANDARNWYESAVARYAELHRTWTQGAVQNVFGEVFG